MSQAFQGQIQGREDDTSDSFHTALADTFSTSDSSRHSLIPAPERTAAAATADRGPREASRIPAPARRSAAPLPHAQAAPTLDTNQSASRSTPHPPDRSSNVDQGSSDRQRPDAADAGAEANGKRNGDISWPQHGPVSHGVRWSLSNDSDTSDTSPRGLWASMRGPQGGPDFTVRPRRGRVIMGTKLRQLNTSSQRQSGPSGAAANAFETDEEGDTSVTVPQALGSDSDSHSVRWQVSGGQRARRWTTTASEITTSDTGPDDTPVAHLGSGPAPLEGHTVPSRPEQLSAAAPRSHASREAEMSVPIATPATPPLRDALPPEAYLFGTGSMTGSADTDGYLPPATAASLDSASHAEPLQDKQTTAWHEAVADPSEWLVQQLEATMVLPSQAAMDGALNGAPRARTQLDQSWCAQRTETGKLLWICLTMAVNLRNQKRDALNPLSCNLDAATIACPLDTSARAHPSGLGPDDTMYVLPADRPSTLTLYLRDESLWPFLASGANLDASLEKLPDPAAIGSFPLDHADHGDAKATNANAATSADRTAGLIMADLLATDESNASLLLMSSQPQDAAMARPDHVQPPTAAYAAAYERLARAARYGADVSAALDDLEAGVRGPDGAGYLRDSDVPDRAYGMPRWLTDEANEMEAAHLRAVQSAVRERSVQSSVPEGSLHSVPELENGAQTSGSPQSGSRSSFRRSIKRVASKLAHSSHKLGSFVTPRAVLRRSAPANGASSRSRPHDAVSEDSATPRGVASAAMDTERYLEKRGMARELAARRRAAQYQEAWWAADTDKALTITDIGGGKHRVTLKPEATGLHLLSITICGEHIAGSPFLLAACPSSLLGNGVFASGLFRPLDSQSQALAPFRPPFASHPLLHSDTFSTQSAAHTPLYGAWRAEGPQLMPHIRSGGGRAPREIEALSPRAQDAQQFGPYADMPAAVNGQRDFAAQAQASRLDISQLREVPQPLQGNSAHTEDVWRLSAGLQNPNVGVVEVVLLVDATSSMTDDVKDLADAVPTLFDAAKSSPLVQVVRVAVVAYTDYYPQTLDGTLVEASQFSTDASVVAAHLRSIETVGGGDYPEAMEAAMQYAATELAWTPRSVRLALWLGDAPPHGYQGLSDAEAAVEGELFERCRLRVQAAAAALEHKLLTLDDRDFQDTAAEDRLETALDVADAIAEHRDALPSGTPGGPSWFSAAAALADARCPLLCLATREAAHHRASCECLRSIAHATGGGVFVVSEGLSDGMLSMLVAEVVRVQVSEQMLLEDLVDAAIIYRGELQLLWDVTEKLEYVLERLKGLGVSVEALTASARDGVQRGGVFASAGSCALPRGSDMDGYRRIARVCCEPDVPLLHKLAAHIHRECFEVTHRLNSRYAARPQHWLRDATWYHSDIAACISRQSSSAQDSGALSQRLNSLHRGPVRGLEHSFSTWASPGSEHGGFPEARDRRANVASRRAATTGDHSLPGWKLGDDGHGGNKGAEAVESDGMPTWSLSRLSDASIVTVHDLRYVLASHVLLHCADDAGASDASW